MISYMDVQGFTPQSQTQPAIQQKQENPSSLPNPVEPRIENVQPQPDERITQAEYEKVVKGARLTDPVEEPISRSCTECILSVCLQDDKPLLACGQHIHSVDDNNKEDPRLDRTCK